jgi:hypothetical protein
MKSRFEIPIDRILIWLAASVTAVGFQLIRRSASLVDGSYLPVGNDSFYHARRILDAVAGDGSVWQFDPRIDVPDGSLIIWPWGYDYAMAAIVRLLSAVGVDGNPMGTLAMIPPVAVAASVALILIIAELMALPRWAAALAAFFYAVSPLTQWMHSVGVVDHHWAENLFVLASVAAGMWWMNRPERQGRAIALGTILGTAQAVHPALFLLQLPIVVTLAMLWIQRDMPPARAVIAFSTALISVTTLAALPSVATRAGHFEYLRLSLFHIYVAVASGAMAIAAASTVRSVRAVATLLITATILAAPIVTQLASAGHFLSREFAALATIGEAYSLPAMASKPGGLGEIAGQYSLLVFVTPLVLIGCIAALVLRPRKPMAYFLISSALGLCMLIAMFRFHPYGSFALLLPLLAACSALSERGHVPKRVMATVVPIAVTLACIPSLARALGPGPGPGGEPYYAVTGAIYPALNDVCRTAPGLVLASNNDGHYIRFHSDCPVIATNFLVTAEDEAAIARVQRYLSMSPDEFLAADSGTRYVLARVQGTLLVRSDGQIAMVGRSYVGQTTPRLPADLLLADADALPASFRLVAELKLQGPHGYPLARLFEVLPDPPPGT